jgi:adenylate kinase
LRIVLLGPPGAGKGTQAAGLAEELRVSRVSSGDLFREHQSRDTELGRLARSYMERGVLVPDEVTIGMMMEWINAEEQADGFVLDGFPRTLAQAEALDKALADSGGADRVVNLEVSREELTRRLGGRFVCRQCQRTYHEEFSPPQSALRCDGCGGELYQREDDRPEAVRKRIQVYSEESAPLVEYYRGTGKLREIDGESSIEQVGRALLAAAR